jgi:hypothetical protein
MDRQSGSDIRSADCREQAARFAFQVRPRRASWAGSHTSALPGPPDRRLIVTFQADVLRVCFLVSGCSLSSDGASGWAFVLLLVVVVYQATVPVDGCLFCC